MTDDEFEDALDRWGADLNRWPEREAGKARRVLAVSRRARRMLTAARSLDEQLRGLRDHAPPAYLEPRIMARLDTNGVPGWVFPWIVRGRWRPALLALAVGAGGFLLGQSVAGPEYSELTEEVMTLAFSDLYAEVNDVAP